MPLELIDRLAVAAPTLFLLGAGAKRPHLKVRSWLTALKKLSLLQGSMDDGFHTHDIVRDHAIALSGQDGVRKLQRAFLEAVISARPEPDGWPLRDGPQRGTAAWYVAIYADIHIRGAVSSVAAPSDEDMPLLGQLIDDSPCLGEASGDRLPSSAPGDRTARTCDWFRNHAQLWPFGNRPLSLAQTARRRSLARSVPPSMPAGRRPRAWARDDASASQRRRARRGAHAGRADPRRCEPSGAPWFFAQG